MAGRDIEEADWRARMRMALFFMMAATFIMAGFVNPPKQDHIGRSLVWGLLALMMMLNLTGLGRGGIMHRSAVRRLLEDETTCEHRRRSHVAGFWAAMASSMIIWVIGFYVPFGTQAAMQVIVTAGVSAALISFATQEWLALRNA